MPFRILASLRHAAPQSRLSPHGLQGLQGLQISLHVSCCGVTAHAQRCALGAAWWGESPVGNVPQARTSRALLVGPAGLLAKYLAGSLNETLLMCSLVSLVLAVPYACTHND